MRLKTYVVATMTEAIPLIKRDLGAEAMILNTKKIKTGGFLGFFQKEKLEVTAAIDPIAQSKPEQPEFPKAQPFKSPVSNNESSAELINELKSIKQFMVQQIKEEQFPEALRLVKDQLTAQEVAQDVQAEIIGKLMVRIQSDNDQTSEDVSDQAREEMVALINEKMTRPVTEDPEIICFIGPTGVGKTTTIAKIAADYMLTKDKKVGLITADTYRIAAVEQLKTYGSILNIPVKVVESPEDVTKAIEDYHNCDIILMDTAGRNYQQAQYVEELRRLLPASSNMQIHLVLSLTAKYEDMKKIIDNFGSISMDELLLTKRDETSSSGAILNLIYHYGIPIRHIANGQSVPDDILAFTPELAVGFIIGEEHHA